MRTINMTLSDDKKLQPPVPEIWSFNVEEHHPGLHLAFESLHQYGVKRTWKNLWMTKKGFVIKAGSTLAESLYIDGDLVIPNGVEIKFEGDCTLKVNGRLHFE